MLQAGPYPWLVIRPCSCRRFCEGVKRQGRYLWVRCLTASGPFEALHTPRLLDNVLAGGDCNWQIAFDFVFGSRTYSFGIDATTNGTGPYGGNNVSWGLAVTVNTFPPPLANYFGSGGVQRFYPSDCREFPDTTLVQNEWFPAFGQPSIAAWDGPFELLWGWPGKDPF